MVLDNNFGLGYRFHKFICQYTKSNRLKLITNKKNSSSFRGSFQINFEKTEIKTVQYQGKETIVVPAIMIMEGVINDGLVLKEQIHPESWNGTPVTVNHPEKDGVTITANSPEVLEKWSIGTVFNAHMDGNKLKAELWIDKERAEKIHPGLIDLFKNTIMEISTGYFADTKAEDGEFNGKKFNNIQSDIKPDHFALLPNSEGACSVDDGCGVRNNVAQAITNAFDKVTQQFSFKKENDQLDIVTLSASIKKEVLEELKGNEMSNNCSGNLSVSDKEAIQYARSICNERKDILKSQISIVMSLDDSFYTNASLKELEILAAGLPKTKNVVSSVNFGARQMPNAKSVSEAGKAMAERPSFLSTLEKKEAA